MFVIFFVAWCCHFFVIPVLRCHGFVFFAMWLSFFHCLAILLSFLCHFHQHVGHFFVMFLSFSQASSEGCLGNAKRIAKE